MFKNFKFDIFYTSFLRDLNKTSNIIYTLIKNFLTTFAIPLALAFVLMVEVPRVQSGVATFDTVPEHATRAAIIIVLTQMVLEFLIHSIEEKHNWKAKAEYNFSFVNLYHRLRYVVGVSDEKEKYRRSPAIYYKMASNLNAAGILVLSIVGSLQEQIVAFSRDSEAWHVALVKLLTTSNLQVMTSVLAGLIMAIVLLAISTRFSRYVAIQASETMQEIANSSEHLLKQEIEDRFISLKQFIVNLNSRVLNALDLSVFDEDDKIEKIDNNRILFYNGKTNIVSREYDMGKQNHRAKFLALLNQIIEERHNE